MLASFPSRGINQDVPLTAGYEFDITRISAYISPKIIISIMLKCYFNRRAGPLLGMLSVTFARAVATMFTIQKKKFICSKQEAISNQNIAELSRDNLSSSQTHQQ